MGNDFEEVFRTFKRTPKELQNRDADLHIDPFATDEQNERDHSITMLLQAYVSSFREKQDLNISFRKTLFRVCLGLLVAAVIFFGVVIALALRTSSKNINDLAALISACVTFLGVIIGILKIIATNVFPADDEKYITEIVRAIQVNDLENKKTNIDAAKKTEESHLAKSD